MTSPKFVPRRISFGTFSGNITESSSGNAPSPMAGANGQSAAAAIASREKRTCSRYRSGLNAAVAPAKLRWRGRVVDPARQDVVLLPDFGRKAAAEGAEELLLAVHRFHPLRRVDAEKLREGFVGQVQALGVDPLPGRDEADGRVHRLALALAALHYPLEDADVVAESGPEELAVLAGPEPVGAEDLRWRGELLAHVQPVAEVVAHVVAGEGKHGHRVAAQDADLAGRRRRRLGRQRGAEEDAVLPVARLEDERDVPLPAGAEENRRDGNAFRVLPLRRDGRALARRCREAAVGMRCLLRGRGRPGTALPVESVRGRRIVVPLPPGRPVRPQGHVGVDGVLLDHLDRVRVRLAAGPGYHAEKAGLGIDRPEPPVVALAQPGDVVTDGPHLPAGLRGDEHGEVRLPAGAGEGAGDVMRLSLGSAEPENQHVLGEPPFLLSEPARDAQRHALLPEERIAAIARAHRPDGVLLWEMADEAPVGAEIAE